MQMKAHPDFWAQATVELSHVDPIMAAIIARYPAEALECKEDAFHTLMRSITGQQISVKAADAIWGRLVGQLAVNPNSSLDAKSVQLIDDESFRAIGYSRQKISYIRSLCEFFTAHSHLERNWANMADAEVIKDITQIRGIGAWTAEMFLMFHLMRPNILPLDDIGLINAVQIHYPAEIKRTKKEVAIFAERWQPWRSVATWYLWRTYDDEAVSY